jgi:ABC-2 type transport system permease protein
MTLTAPSDTTAPADRALLSPSVTRTFLALLVRDVRVLKRDAVGFVVRLVMQPLLFVFVFAYVLPEIGGFGAAGAGGASAEAANLTFATILVPGLIAVSINFQGVQSVAIPLVRDFSYSKEIEDRVLAPVPVWVIGLQKIVGGALQACVAAAVVLPVVTFVHAEGQGPQLEPNWPLFALVVVLSGLLTSALGLFLGTIIDPNKLNLLFSVVLLPITFLGCVYYPWSQLDSIPWLQAIVCLNPLVYISEGLRWALTPQIGHMPSWAILLALVGGTIVLTFLSLRTFTRRVVT